MTGKAARKGDDYEDTLSDREVEEEAAETLSKIVEMPKPPPKVNREMEVNFIGAEVYKGKRALETVSNPNEVRLMESSLVHLKDGKLFVHESDFNAAEKPYDFAQEIEQITYTPAQIRRALYWGGHFAKGEDVRRLIATLIRAGTLPVKK